MVRAARMLCAIVCFWFVLCAAVSLNGSLYAPLEGRFYPTVSMGDKALRFVWARLGWYAGIDSVCGSPDWHAVGQLPDWLLAPHYALLLVLLACPALLASLLCYHWLLARTRRRCRCCGATVESMRATKCPRCGDNVSGPRSGVPWRASLMARVLLLFAVLLVVVCSIRQIAPPPWDDEWGEPFLWVSYARAVPSWADIRLAVQDVTEGAVLWVPPLLASFAMYGKAINRITSGASQCMKCGYLLRGLSVARCPECGTATEGRAGTPAQPERKGTSAK